jgi:hypothetical protein
MPSIIEGAEEFAGNRKETLQQSGAISTKSPSPERSVLISFLFFLFEETSPSRKAYFVGPGEGVKPRLSQALTRDARPDSN